MMNFRNVNQKEYPEIRIYWKHKKKDAVEYKKACSQMRVGQIEKCSEDMVGIVEISDSRFVIPVIASDDAMEQAPGSLAAFCYITDAYLPMIATDEYYYHRKKDDEDYLCTLYHEIGHFYLRHLKKTETLDEEISKRELASQNGEVYWIELEADAFACHYLGKEAMLRHIDVLKEIAMQKKISKSGQEELKIRKAAIHALAEQEVENDINY